MHPKGAAVAAGQEGRNPSWKDRKILRGNMAHKFLSWNGFEVQG